MKNQKQTTIHTKARRKLRWDRVGILIGTLIICLSFALSAAGEPYPHETQVSIKVEQGDSLWTLIKSANPNFHGDMNKAIYETQKLNDLDTANLQVGEYLEIPTDF